MPNKVLVYKECLDECPIGSVAYKPDYIDFRICLPKKSDTTEDNPKAFYLKAD